MCDTGYYCDDIRIGVGFWNSRCNNRPRYLLCGGGVTFEVGDDCINKSDFTTIKVDKVTKTAVVQQPANPNQLGKTFEGWYTDSSITQKVDKFPVTLSKGDVLYANYYDASTWLTLSWNATTSSYSVERSSSSSATEAIIPDIYDDGTHGVAVVDTIGSYSLTDVTTLTNIYLSNNITTISERAFSACANVTAINVPENVATIGAYWLQNMKKLKTINWNAINAEYTAEFSQTYSVGSQYGIDFIVGYKVQSIPRYLFNPQSSKSYVKSIDMTNATSLKEIGSWAFGGCYKITSLTIPASVELIGAYAFTECTGLSSITFEVSDNWYRFSSETATTGGTALSLGSAYTDAKWIRDTYAQYWWRRIS